VLYHEGNLAGCSVALEEPGMVGPIFTVVEKIILKFH
jgi:hypothetical protein